MTPQTKLSRLVEEIIKKGKEVYLSGRDEPGILINIEADKGALIDKVIDAGINDVVKNLDLTLYIARPSEDIIEELGSNGITIKQKYSQMISLKDRIANTPLDVLLEYSLIR
ncbi:MAG: hypothetical protein AABW50_03300 [Nanoarchaeota archaeon]